MQSQSRPLSPHLQIYRPQWTSVLSIMHRFSGLLLSAGMVLLTVWLVALASGPELFTTVAAGMAHPVMVLVWMVWTMALFYHLLNGIRHLIWDAGMMMDIPSARRSAWVVVLLALSLNLLIWVSLL
ncbi:MAG: succinate dehydrogenase, cytochrome b556 subunit [Pseudomonadota bacterium]